jgi:putative DNA topoisomerase
LHVKHVGKNSFIGCTNYPTCEYTHSLNQHEVLTLKEIDGSTCPECDSILAVKKGRYGMFIGCTNFPECHFISTKQNKQTQSEFKPVCCPQCKKGLLQKRQNKFGKFFYACDTYPKCKHIENQEPVERTCPGCNANIMLVKTKGEKVYICADQSCAHIVEEA